MEFSISPMDVWDIPMEDLIGMWEVKKGKYDQRTYEYEIDNLEKFKRKFNAK